MRRKCQLDCMVVFILNQISHFIKTHLINTKLFAKIILCKKHASTEVFSFSKKITYKEKGRTVLK